MIHGSLNDLASTYFTIFFPVPSSDLYFLIPPPSFTRAFFVSWNTPTSLLTGFFALNVFFAWKCIWSPFFTFQPNYPLLNTLCKYICHSFFFFINSYLFFFSYLLKSEIILFLYLLVYLCQPNEGKNLVCWVHCFIKIVAQNSFNKLFF